MQIAEHIRHRLSDDLPTVEFNEVGQTLVGRLLSVGSVDLGWGEHPVIQVLTPKGNVARAHVMGSTIISDWTSASPSVGDYIGIKYMGEKQGKDNKYHAFRFVHVPSWLATELTSEGGTVADPPATTQEPAHEYQQYNDAPF